MITAKTTVTLASDFSAGDGEHFTLAELSAFCDKAHEAGGDGDTPVYLDKDAQGDPLVALVVEVPA